jgi:hypothetical protein
MLCGQRGYACSAAVNAGKEEIWFRQRELSRVATFIQDGWEHSCAGMCSQDEH